MPRLRFAFLVLAGFLLTSAASAQFTINTVIGGGPNNSPAAAWPRTHASSMITDAAGNLYFATQNRVFKLATNGKVFLVAGYGTHDISGRFGGDGGPAINAGLSYMLGLALNAAGTALFIADTGNHVIRRVDLTTGLIHTVAGTPGIFGSRGDGGLATSAGLGSAQDVAVDSVGNLYVVDGHKIRKVDASTQIISTFAGSGAFVPSPDGPAATVALQAPSSIAIDSFDRVYIAEAHGHRIRRIAGGVATTVVGTGVPGFAGDGGPGAHALLNFPLAVRIDSDGNLLIADSYNLRVRKVDVSTWVISTLAGSGEFSAENANGPALSASVLPSAIAPDVSGGFFFADGSIRLQRFDKATAMISTVIGNGDSLLHSQYSGDGGLASDAEMAQAGGVATDAAGNIFVSDPYNHTVRRVDAVTGIITRYAGNGTEGFSGDGGAAIDAALNAPIGLAIDASSNLYISDSKNHRIRRVTPSGVIITFAGTGVSGYSGDGGPATAAQLFQPEGVAVDISGNILVADTLNLRVRKISPGRIITTFAGNGQSNPIVNNGLATAQTIIEPRGLASDLSGNVFVSDRSYVRKISGANMHIYAGNGLAGFDGDGQPATSATLYNPAGLAVDTAGNLYIADSSNQRIRMVAAGTGTMLTVAGTGVYGMGGDGGPATLAKLGFPLGVAVAPNGTVLVADHINSRVRALTLTCSYGLPANSVVLNAVQGTYAFMIDAPEPCNWTAVSDSPSWLQLTSPGTKSGPGSVSFSVTQNSGAARTGHVAIAGLTYTVTQNAACAYTLSATGASLTSAAQGPYSIQISTEVGCAWTATSNDPGWLTITGNASGTATGITHFSVAANTGPQRVGTLSVAGKTYTVSQATGVQTNPSMPAKIAVFRSGILFVDGNANSSWDGSDTFHYFGAAADKPITGDWTNSGITRMGIFRDGAWYLDINNNGRWDGASTDAIAYFGMAGDLPVVGDWTGNGRMRIGVFRNGVWFQDLNEDWTWNGQPTDGISYFGTLGDVPVVSDWTGTGRQRIGIFRNGLWVVDINGNNYFDGTSTDAFFTFGTAGDSPVTGDWTGTGHKRIGIFRNGLWVVDTNGNKGFDGVDTFFYFGSGTDQPLVF